MYYKKYFTVSLLLNFYTLKGGGNNLFVPTEQVSHSEATLHMSYIMYITYWWLMIVIVLLGGCLAI